jgi:hypothetical protein
LNQKIWRFRFSRATAFIISGFAVLAIGGGIATAGAASASVTPIQVTLSASSDGSATCSSSGDIVLTTGSAVSTTYGQADVNGVAGTTLSATSEPTFVTDHYAAGSPRWVIELNNGHSLWGYPPNSGLNGSDFAWAVDNGNTYTSYATAYANASAGSTTIKDAFIVEDGDQVSTTDTISGATFNGQPLSCMQPAPTPTPTPSSSPSHAPYPTGGVQTGGGKPVTSLLLPVGVSVAGLGLLALAGGAVARRRQQG